jgi:rare lipoprotein A
MRYFVLFCFILPIITCCSVVDKKLAYFGVGNCVNKYSKNTYKGHAKLGKTYAIKDKEYTPEVDHNYNQEGLASWYGDDFHCKKTANGESFNKWEMSAAHRTLPLPSVVRVTNLSNNKSIKVTVNDRGPFVDDKNRIIDLSEGAASKLGFKHKGIEKVRVEYLHQESLNLVAKLELPEHVYFKNDKMKVRKRTSIEEDDNTLKQFFNSASNEKSKTNEKIIVAEFKNKKDAIIAMGRLAKFGNVRFTESVPSSKNKFYKVHLTGFSGKKSQLLKKINGILGGKKIE